MRNNVWALQDTADLMKMSINESADIYADIGYMEELIPESGSDSALAVEFFKYLYKYCVFVGDNDCTRLMYGSDWIMLGIETNHEKYLEVVENALSRAGWTEIMKRNFLTNNLRKFLEINPI